MQNIIKCIDCLNRLSEDDIKRFNELYNSTDENLPRNPQDRVVECLKQLIRDKEDAIINKVQIPVVRDTSYYDLFTDTIYMCWMYTFTMNPTITPQNMYQVFGKNLGVYDKENLDRLEDFFKGLREFADYELKNKGIDYYYQNESRVWFNILYKDNLFKVYAHPNSSRGITFCRASKLTDINGETMINFEDLKNYYFSLRFPQVKNGVQRTHKDN